MTIAILLMLTMSAEGAPTRTRAATLRPLVTPEGDHGAITAEERERIRTPYTKEEFEAAGLFDPTAQKGINAAYKQATEELDALDAKLKAAGISIEMATTTPTPSRQSSTGRTPASTTSTPIRSAALEREAQAKKLERAGQKAQEKSGQRHGL